MSTQTLSRHTTHRQPNFVAPLSEREIGRQLYRQGKRLSACVTDDMTAGWLDAEAAGAQMFLRHAEAEHMPARAALSVVGGAW